MSSLVEACADPRLRNILEFTISQLEFLKMETLDLMSEEGRRAYEVTIRLSPASACRAFRLSDFH